MLVQDHTYSGAEIVVLLETWLRGEPERVCKCGFYCDDENHEECDGAAS